MLSTVIMEKDLNFNGVKLHYTVTGDGAGTVILMHGWGCTGDTVESIRRVAAENHRVITVDFPGFGQSSEPQEASGGSVWGVEEYTRLIERLAEVEEAGEPILVGHSFGGRVGLLFASRNRVSKLVLVDAAGVRPRRPLKYYVKVYSFKASKAFYRLLMGREKSAARIERMRAARGSADYAGASPMMRRVLSKVVNEDLKHVMPMIKAPTLLVWGENDTATPLSDAKIMERLIPDAGIVSFPGCGHYSFLDNPYGFAAVLRNFINNPN